MSHGKCAGNRTIRVIPRCFALAINTINSYLILFCIQYGGELDFKAFLEFVLAVEYRTSSQSTRYMFRLFDLSKRGLLVRADLKYFMRSVLDKLVSEGHDRLDLDSCVDEVWDSE